MRIDLELTGQLLAGHQAQAKRSPFRASTNLRSSSPLPPGRQYATGIPGSKDWGHREDGGRVTPRQPDFLRIFQRFQVLTRSVETVKTREVAEAAKRDHQPCRPLTANCRAPWRQQEKNEGQAVGDDLALEVQWLTLRSEHAGRAGQCSKLFPKSWGEGCGD